MSEFLESLGLREERPLIDRSDEIFAHPLVREMWPPYMSGSDYPYLDPAIPHEEKLAERARFRESLMQLFYPDGGEDPNWKKFMVEKGCPEESDAPAQEITIRYPLDWDGKTALPVVFSINGGGLIMCFTDLYKGYNEPIADELGCAVVAPIYRTAIDAEYPACINDLHAAYVWVMEHAEELHLDADNITLFGSSSGGHLALSLAFRLKRYGLRPRGAVVELPITDDRLTKASSRIFVCEDAWQGANVHRTSQFWLGRNFGSPFLGPEAFPNYASAEECKGLCPVFITTFDLDPDCCYSLEFASKLIEAGVFVNYQLMSGATHNIGGFSAADEGVAEFVEMDTRFVHESIAQCARFDLRRPA